MEEPEPSCKVREQPLWDTVRQFFTTLNRDWPYAQVDTHEKQKRMFTRNLCVNVHCSVIHKSQKVGMTPMSVNK